MPVGLGGHPINSSVRWVADIQQCAGIAATVEKEPICLNGTSCGAGLILGQPSGFLEVILRFRGTFFSLLLAGVHPNEGSRRGTLLV